ncbi:MAG: DUF501 domain-containing protein [Actinomycetota bacterium]|nr:DUF501 domain-containing protein [Actinomycetota bacterium]
MTPADDRVVIEAQIGRPLRAESEVISRCHLDLPVVVRVPPLLVDGTPFPTLYWLTCPLAVTRIGRLEGTGGVKRMEAKADADSGFGAGLEEAHRSYEEERNALLPSGASPAPSGGVGGARTGVKCLHAHYAHSRSGGKNPVGGLVQEWIEPLDCSEPCVIGEEMNPAWVNRP